MPWATRSPDRKQLQTKGRYLVLQAQYLNYGQLFRRSSTSRIEMAAVLGLSDMQSISLRWVR